MEEKTAINLKDSEVKPKKNKKDKHESHSTKREAWSSGIKILDKIDVFIPVKLLLVCNRISDKVRSDEFSIVTNIIEKDDYTLVLSDEYYIPKQKVASTSIEYLPDSYTFNTVIHRHPNGMNNFSSTDRNYINQNFELSILYTKEEGFVNGVYNLRYGNYLIQIPVEIYIDYGLEEIDISNIERETFLSNFNRNRFDEWRSDKRTELFPAPDEIDKADSKLSTEESLDYNMMRELLLEEINGEIQNLDYRLCNIEDSMFHGGYSMISGDPPF